MTGRIIRVVTRRYGLSMPMTEIGFFLVLITAIAVAG